ncbi:MAG: RIP metalloprotease RseP [Deltaproteobacteria bacterium]|nr:RIP metalloprotease RseP [Deltaproteobacteria bacterium]
MTTIVATIVLLGLLIFVHELGHFLMAKALGVRVERFSLGFPPKMFGKQFGETEYVLSWIPLGGYVKMYGENPEEEANIPLAEQSRSFAHKPSWARFLIVLAGPGFNFIFAFLIFWIIYVSAGLPHLSPVIGRVTANSPAAQAGIEPLDRIESVDGRPILYYDQFVELTRASQGQPISILLTRNEKQIRATAKPVLMKSTDIFGDELREYDVGVEPYLGPHIGNVQPNMPADVAGLKPGDKIIKINDQIIKDWYDVLDLVQASRGQKIKVEIERNGIPIQTTLVPRLVTSSESPQPEKPIYRIGIERRDETMTESVNPLMAVSYSALRTWELTRLTIISVVKLIQRKLSVNTLGGPIFIAELAGKQAEAGLLALLSLCALLSLNLGILNLLPIPVLDGGHLFFFAIEMVWRPLNLKIRERAQQVGMIFLIMFMAFIFYNDIARLVNRWTQPSVKTQVEEHENPGSGHVNSNR